MSAVEINAVTEEKPALRGRRERPSCSQVLKQPVQNWQPHKVAQGLPQLPFLLILQNCLHHFSDAVAPVHGHCGELLKLLGGKDSDECDLFGERGWGAGIGSYSPNRTFTFPPSCSICPIANFQNHTLLKMEAQFIQSGPASAILQHRGKST